MFRLISDLSGNYCTFNHFMEKNIKKEDQQSNLGVVTRIFDNLKGKLFLK
jgi:hypothetical protein